MGWGHGFGEQTVPIPWKMPVQLAWVMTEQAPVAAQHAPFNGFPPEVVPFTRMPTPGALTESMTSISNVPTALVAPQP